MNGGSSYELSSAACNGLYGCRAQCLKPSLALLRLVNQLVTRELHCMELSCLQWTVLLLLRAMPQTQLGTTAQTREWWQLHCAELSCAAAGCAALALNTSTQLGTARRRQTVTAPLS